jgi:hypothetical protein
VAGDQSAQPTTTASASSGVAAATPTTDTAQQTSASHAVDIKA